MRDEPCIKLYTLRRSGIPVGVVGAVFLLGSFSALLGGLLRGPLDVVAFVGCVILGAFGFLYGCYYLLAPVPLLKLDQSGVAYQGLPLVVRKVRWEDVERVAAIKTRIWQAGRGYIKNADLTLSIKLKPHAVSAYNGKTVFAWTFSYADLPVPVEEIVAHIRRFFPVEYRDMYDDLSLPHR